MRFVALMGLMQVFASGSAFGQENASNPIQVSFTRRREGRGVDREGLMTVLVRVPKLFTPAWFRLIQHPCLLVHPSLP